MQTARQPVRILLVDDHPIAREGLRSFLATREGFEVVAEAGDGGEAVRKAAQYRPDVVLMDVSLPVMSGLEATRQISDQLPSVRVLAVTVYDSREYVLQLIRSGARGYILKDTSPEELVQAIIAVHEGGSFFSPKVAQFVLDDYVQHAGQGKTLSASSLSEREREVLKLVAKGLSTKEIAVQLGVSPKTIKTHRDRIMTKLDIHTAAGLGRFAAQIGLI